MSTKPLITAEDLLRPPFADRRCELVQGEVIEMTPAGALHGDLAAEFALLLRQFAKVGKLGRVFGAETGFLLRRDPDTVRAPDDAFVAAGRPPAGRLPRGFLELAPDLAVECVSPHDSAGEVQR